LLQLVTVLRDPFIRRGFAHEPSASSNGDVLIVTVGCGWIARQLEQARVIGKIIGGILIGPSVFGRPRFGGCNHAAV